MRVTIALNADPLAGYRGDFSDITTVSSYEDVSDRDDFAICERAFEMFNIGDPDTNEVVRLYRSAGHRSLSVGDVVIVDNRAYGCSPCGWMPLPVHG